MLGLVVYQPSEMVNHFLPAPPAPPAKPPDRDKLIINWLDSSSLEEEPSMQGKAVSVLLCSTCLYFSISASEVVPSASEEYCEATALAEEMMRPSGSHHE